MCGRGERESARYVCVCARAQFHCNSHHVIHPPNQGPVLNFHRSQNNLKMEGQKRKTKRFSAVPYPVAELTYQSKLLMG